jgi:hypothetical protein
MDTLFKLVRYNIVVLGFFLVFVILVGYKLNALTSENIRLDELHRSGYEEITVETEGQGATPEKAEYDAKRQASNKIFGERVHSKTEMSSSYSNEQRNKDYKEISGSEFDSKFKSITVISVKQSENEDSGTIWNVQIRAVGIREINSQQIQRTSPSPSDFDY